MKGRGFVRDRTLRVPRGGAVERTIEGDEIIFDIVPGRINFTVGADKRHSADSLARAGRIVNAGDSKSSSGIGRASDVDATIGGVPSTGGIPTHVNTAAEGAHQIRVGRNHRLVIERS